MQTPQKANLMMTIKQNPDIRFTRSYCLIVCVCVCVDGVLLLPVLHSNANLAVVGLQR